MPAPSHRPSRGDTEHDSCCSGPGGVTLRDTAQPVHRGARALEAQGDQVAQRDWEWLVQQAQGRADIPGREPHTQHGQRAATAIGPCDCLSPALYSLAQHVWLSGWWLERSPHQAPRAPGPCLRRSAAHPPRRAGGYTPRTARPLIERRTGSVGLLLLNTREGFLHRTPQCAAKQGSRGARYPVVNAIFPETSTVGQDSSEQLTWGCQVNRTGGGEEDEVK